MRFTNADAARLRRTLAAITSVTAGGRGGDGIAEASPPFLTRPPRPLGGRSLPLVLGEGGWGGGRPPKLFH